MKLNHYVPGKFGGYLAITGVLLFFVSLLSSCLKSNNEDYNPGQSNLLVVNAYPGTAGVSFWYAGSLVSANPLAYSSNSSYYGGLLEGAQIAFTKGKSTAQSDILATGNAMGDEKDYSVFVTGVGDSTFLVRDDLITADASKVAVRFVNASKSAGAVDVKINDAAAFTNIAFQKNSSFMQFDGPTVNETKISITINVNATGTSTSIATANLTLDKGKVYTIYTRGVKDSQDESKALGLGFVNHTAAKTPPQS